MKMKSKEYIKSAERESDMRSYLLETYTRESDEFIQDLDLEGCITLIDKYYLGGVKEFDKTRAENN
jgi:hypothetical protein